MKTFTEREEQVLQRIVQGKQNKAIAKELGIAEGTVKVHVSTAMARLNVSNRTAAAVAYLAMAA